MPGTRRKAVVAPETRDERAAATRRAIVEGAIDVFAERGFDGSTLRDVAERSGVKQPLIVYHFRDKESLFRAAASETWARMKRATVDAATNASADLDGRPNAVTTRARLRTVLRAICGAAAAQPAYLRMLLREASHDGERYAWIASTHMDANFREAVSLVEVAQAAGILPQASAKHLVYVLIGALTFPLAVAADAKRQIGVAPDSPEYLDAHVDAIMALFGGEDSGPTEHAEGRRVGAKPRAPRRTARRAS